MTDRVASAERLLATVQVGRAHVRALALRHLPPGRALALDLRVAAGRPGPPIVRPAPPPRPTVEGSAAVAPHAALDAVELDARASVPDVSPSASTVRGDGHQSSGSSDASAPPAVADPASAELPPEDSLPAAITLSAVAGVVATAALTDAPSAATDPPAEAADALPDGDLDDATQVIEVDDALQAAIAAAPAPSSATEATPPPAPRVLEASTDSLDWGSAPAQHLGPPDEDTTDEDTDPGLLAPAVRALSGGAGDPDEELSGTSEPTLLAEGAPLLGGALLGGGLLGADAPSDDTDAATGWEDDDEASIVEEGTIGGMSWDSPDSGASGNDDDLSGSFEDTLALHFPDAVVPESAAADATSVAPIDEPDDERTRIGAADPALLEAIQASDAARASDDPEDDFALTADQLHWGDAHGDPRDELVSASVDSRVDAAPDELQWGDDASWDAGAPSPDLLDDLDSEEDGLDVDLPRVTSWADEHEDAAETDAELAELDVHEPDTADEPALPDVLEDDPLDEARIQPAPPVAEPDTAQVDAVEPEPADSMPMPVLAVPRVVEPMSGDRLDEPTGAAAIQILGVGRAQTLTPTLELGGAPDESDSAAVQAVPAPATDDGGFSLQFEEPEEESTGPHIPTLTEDVAVPLKPAVLSPDGLLLRNRSRPTTDSAASSGAVQRFLELAEAAEKKGNLADAVLHYDDLLSHAPHNLVGHLGRGRCHVDLGDYGSAMSDFTRAEDIAPDSPEPLVEMGNLFFARKEYKRAITYYNHAIDLDNRHAMAFSRRGISYYHRRMYAEAHNDLIEAEKRDDSIPGLQRYIQMTSRKLKKRR